MKRIATPLTLPLLALWLGASLPAAAADETFPITDKDGKTLTVRPVACLEQTFTFVRAGDKKEFSVPLERLNEESLGKIEEWKASGGNLAESFEVTVSTGKTRKKSGNEDFDDKCVNLDPTVTIKNTDTARASRACKMSVVFLGRPVNDRSYYYVFTAQSFNLPSLQPGLAKDFDVAPVTRNYDTRGYAKFGARYLGYAVLLYDEETLRVISAKSVPTTLAEKYGVAFLDLKKGGTYNEVLQRVENFRVYSDD